MKIEWKNRTGKDAQGNIYRSPEHGETVTVETPDGRKGCGWTPEEALQNVSGFSFKGGIFETGFFGERE